MGRIRLLQGSEIEPGGSAAAQIELEQPVIVARGDRFILRRPTPGSTLGGGMVLDPSPPSRYRRRDRSAVRRLEALAAGGDLDLVRQAILRLVYATVDDVARATGLERGAAQSAIDALAKRGDLVSLGAPGWMDREAWSDAKTSVVDGLSAFHRSHPLRTGMPRAELRSRLGWEPPVFAAVVSQLSRDGDVREAESRLALAQHVAAPDADGERRLADILARFADAPHSPPAVAECREVLGAELFAFAVEAGKLIQISDEVAFRPEDFAAMKDTIISRLAERPATVAQIRDLLGSSRKYVLAVLEYLDGQGVTIREGDERRLGKSRPS